MDSDQDTYHLYLIPLLAGRDLYAKEVWVHPEGHPDRYRLQVAQVTRQYAQQYLRRWEYEFDSVHVES